MPYPVTSCSGQICPAVLSNAALATYLRLSNPFTTLHHDITLFASCNNAHRRFHTGQTITLSLILGLATLFLTYRPDLASSRSPSSSTAAPSSTHPAAIDFSQAQVIRRESIKFAAFTGSIYWLAGLAAWFYPGAEGRDPEFGGTGFPQGWLFGGFAACALVGGWLGGRR